MYKYKKLLFKFIIILLPFVVVVVCGELIIRVFRPQNFHFRNSIPHPDYNHTYSPGFSGIYVFGPEKYKTLEKFNSLGLKQEEEIDLPKPTGVYRILVIGDSFVAGLNRPATIPHAIKEALKDKTNSHIRQFDVVNAGQSSYSPLLYLSRLKHQFLSLDPDAIILLPDLTDVFDDYHRYKKAARYDENGKLLGVSPSGILLNQYNSYIKAGYYKTNSHLIRFLISRFSRYIIKYDSTSPYGTNPNEYIFAHAREDKNNPSLKTIGEVGFAVKNLEEFIDVARLHDIHISVATYPHHAQILPECTVRKGSGNSKIFNRIFEKEIELLCKSKNVPFKSFYEEIEKDVFSGRKVFFEGDMHFNECGFIKLGGYISEWILAYPKQTIGTELP